MKYSERVSIFEVVMFLMTNPFNVFVVVILLELRFSALTVDSGQLQNS